MTVLKGPWRPRPGRHDDANAELWRGALFESMQSLNVYWRDGAAYHFLDKPKSITFPICCLCHHVVWDWPHYEEAVPDNACCDRCAAEEAANG